MDNVIEKIMESADNMAAAATTFNSHGYDNFIRAREQLLEELKALEPFIHLTS